MQPGYAYPMTLDSPRHATRRANLELVLGMDFVQGPTGLALLIGSPSLKGHFSNIRHRKRGMGDALASAIENACNLPPGWMDVQHLSAGEPAPTYEVAQHLSQSIRYHPLPRLTLEQIVTGSTPDVFCTVVRDDAMAPEYPAGTEIVWTKLRRAIPGRLVLIQDGHGQVHVRQCHQGRAPGQWIAAASNAAYVNFSSTDEGFTLVAVFKGRLEPDD